MTDFTLDRLKAGSWRIYGQPVRGRKCGSCTFCCTAVPVQLADEHKPAGVRCKHVCGKGCGIYPTRPPPCVAWNCTWLFHEATKDMRRPDHAGYVIDPMPQSILIDKNEIGALQIWVDPKRPEAHTDPALRDYLTAMCAEHGFVGLVRWAHPQDQEGQEGMALVPPGRYSDVWIESRTVMIGEAEMAKRLKEVHA